MISFKILTPENKDGILAEIFENIPDANKCYTSDIVNIHAEDDRGYEYAISHSNGCLLIRMYDDEYSFAYPIVISKTCDRIKAALEIRAYAVKEEIPLVYYDVPGCEVGNLVTNFRHVNIDSANALNRFYTVRVMSELALVGEIPEYTNFFGFSLTAFTPDDDEDYAKLCMDKESNQYWGYDYSEDEPNPEKSYFRQIAEEEFYQSRALCLAVRHKGEFVGEAILYYFDLFGGCECAVRILPEHRRKGYAIQALRMLKVIAKRMGLVNLGAMVDENNTSSIAMTEKMFREIGREAGRVKFSIKL